MKRVATIILFLITLEITSGAQDFLNNSDYIYGVGVTDSAAIMSLASSICVSVTSKIDYTIESQGKKTSENFHKTIGLSSSMVIRDSRQYLDADGKYYRYINKAEYIRNKESEYFSCLNEVERINSNATRNRKKHEINLILGYYYKAYCSMSEPLIVGLIGNKALQRSDNAISLAKRTYVSGKYGRITLYCKNYNGYIAYVGGGYVTPTTAQPADLFGFEYMNGDKWDSPKTYYDNYCMAKAHSMLLDNGKQPSKCCYIKSATSKVKYRILYECIEDGSLVKISVPDTWYFENFSISNPLFLN